MAICAQSRPASSESSAQRGAQLDAQVGVIAGTYVATALSRRAARASNIAIAPRRSEAATASEAAVVPCSQAHTKGLQRRRNSRPTLSTRFCRAYQRQCGDN